MPGDIAVHLTLELAVKIVLGLAVDITRGLTVGIALGYAADIALGLVVGIPARRDVGLAVGELAYGGWHTGVAVARAMVLSWGAMTNPTARAKGTATTCSMSTSTTL